VSRRAWVTVASALAGAALLAWLAPALLAAPALAGQARSRGIDVDWGGLRPAWPLGFRAASATVRTPDASLALSELRALLGRSSLLATAQIGPGSLELQSSLHASSGRLFLRSVPLEAIELRRVRGVELRGRVSGAASWESDLRFSGRAEAVLVRWLGGILSTRVDHLAVLGEWQRAQQRTRIEQLEAVGPSFALTGSGEVSDLGELALQLEVQRVDERLLRSFRLLGLPPPERFPARYALVGPWQRPRLEPLP
jgi:hypothetical protein